MAHKISVLDILDESLFSEKEIEYIKKNCVCIHEKNDAEDEIKSYNGYILRISDLYRFKDMDIYSQISEHAMSFSKEIAELIKVTMADERSRDGFMIYYCSKSYSYLELVKKVYYYTEYNIRENIENSWIRKILCMLGII